MVTQSPRSPSALTHARAAGGLTDRPLELDVIGEVTPWSSYRSTQSEREWCETDSEVHVRLVGACLLETPRNVPLRVSVMTLRVVAKSTISGSVTLWYRNTPMAECSKGA